MLWKKQLRKLSFNLIKAKNERLENMKITLHMVRHGETSFNFEEKVQGWGDSFITPEGLKKVAEVGKFWAKENRTFDKVYSSDSGRTLETTRTILKEMPHRYDIVPTPGLREYNFGIYEGLFEKELDADLMERVGKAFHQMGSKPEIVLDAIAALDRERKGEVANTWYAETGSEFSNRIVNAVTDIINESLRMGHREILVVSHGLTIIILGFLLTPDDFKKFSMAKGGIANASVTTLVYENGKFTLTGLGEEVAEQTSLF